MEFSSAGQRPMKQSKGRIMMTVMMSLRKHPMKLFTHCDGLRGGMFDHLSSNLNATTPITTTPSITLTLLRKPSIMAIPAEDLKYIISDKYVYNSIQSCPGETVILSICCVHNPGSSIRILGARSE